MFALIIGIHVVVCILLIAIILIQAGRGGGLVESFSNVESMFGPKTNAFLTRTTTVLAVSFFVTCLGLALLSAQQSRSLMRNIKPGAKGAVANQTAEQVAVNQTAEQQPTPQDTSNQTQKSAP